MESKLSVQMRIFTVLIVNFAMLDLLSEVFGKFRNTRLRVTELTDDAAVRTADGGREVKSQDYYEVARGQRSRAHGKCIL